MTTPEQIASAVAETMRTESAAIISRIEDAAAQAVDLIEQSAMTFQGRLNAKLQERTDQIEVTMIGLQEAAATARETGESAARAIQASADSAVSALVDASASQRNILSRAIALAEQEVEQVLGRIQSAQADLSTQITRATEAERSAGAVIAKSDAELAKARERIEEADKATARAEKALRVLTMAGEHEVARATAEIEFKAREKATLQKLARERDEMENRFDAEASHLQSALNTFYPELRAKLDELTASTEPDQTKN